jgi:hypothetical protein
MVVCDEERRRRRRIGRGKELPSWGRSPGASYKKRLIE